MKKEVELSIRGLHKVEDEPDQLETVTAAEYYNRNGSHYLLYEEKIQGVDEVVRNRIKLHDNVLEFTKQGIVDTKMIFEENKRHAMNYATPYGCLPLNVHTTKVTVEEQENRIHVMVAYVLEMDETPVSQCKLEIEIRERS